MKLHFQQTAGGLVVKNFVEVTLRFIFQTSVLCGSQLSNTIVDIFRKSLTAFYFGVIIALRSLICSRLTAGVGVQCNIGTAFQLISGRNFRLDIIICAADIDRDSSVNVYACDETVTEESAMSVSSNIADSSVTVSSQA